MYRLNDGTMVDVSGYDETRMEIFLIQNPDAVLVETQESENFPQGPAGAETNAVPGTETVTVSTSDAGLSDLEKRAKGLTYPNRVRPVVIEEIIRGTSPDHPEPSRGQIVYSHEFQLDPNSNYQKWQNNIKAKVNQSGITDEVQIALREDFDKKSTEYLMFAAMPEDYMAIHKKEPVNPGSWEFFSKQWYNIERAKGNFVNLAESKGNEELVEQQLNQKEKVINNNQQWNSLIAEINTLDNQVEEMYFENDLDLDSNGTNMYYVDKGNIDLAFVEEHYNVPLLEDMGININDFIGFLNDNANAQDFFQNVQDKHFIERGDTMSSNPGGTQNSLTASKQRRMADFLGMYIQENQAHQFNKGFYDDYMLNPGDYADFKNLEDAKAWFKTNYGAYQKLVIDYNKLGNYVDTEFAVMNEYDRIAVEKRKQKMQAIDERNIRSSSGVENTIAPVTNFLLELLPGAYQGISETAVWLQDAVGDDRGAAQMRLLLEEEDVLDWQKDLNYGWITGKALDYNGKRYLIDETGSMYNITDEYRVDAETWDDGPEAYQEVYNEVIRSGEEDSSFNARGMASQGGNVVGNIIFQVLGTKGVGSARAATSLSYMARANGFKSTAQFNKYLKMVNKGGTNMRGIKNPKSFGLGPERPMSLNLGKINPFSKKPVKIPLSVEMVDAAIFQSFYGATRGYEETLKAAKAAGLTDAESEALASEAELKMAVLYAVTGPIAPRIGSIKYIDDMVFGSKTAREVVKSYTQTGSKEAFNRTLGERVKENLRNLATSAYGTGTTFFQEGVKETIQENIQQAGEFLIVNAETNEKVGREIIKENYTYQDFVNTSMLSFAAGGLVGGFTASSNIRGYTPKSDVKLTNLIILGKDLKGARNRLEYMVGKGKISQEKVEEILQDAENIKKAGNKLPSFMINDPDAFIKSSGIQAKIDALELEKKRLDKAYHAEKDAEIETLRLELEEVALESKTKLTDKGIEIAEEVYGERVKKLSIEEMVEAGYDPANLTADGFFIAEDGTIVVNRDLAIERGAIAVASHELLHKILAAELKANPEQSVKIINEFRNILKGVTAVDGQNLLDLLDKRIQAGNYDVTINADGSVVGEDIDEYLNFFSDSIAKREISFDQLQESQWMEMGKSIMNWINNFLGIDKSFKSGRQVFDFIRDYQKAYSEGKATGAAKRKLKKFKPSKTPTKKSITTNKSKAAQQKVATALENISKADAETSAVVKNALPGMIGAQIDNLAANFDADNAYDMTLDIYARLTTPNKNGKAVDLAWDGRGTLYGFLNGRIRKRILDVLKADRKRVDPLYVNQISTDAISTLEKQSNNDSKPTQNKGPKKFTKIKNSGKINPRVKAKALKVAELLAKTIKTRADERSSAKNPLNAKVIPIIRELLTGVKGKKGGFGFSLLYDEIINQLGTVPNKKLETELLKLKKAILENATTTWLMGSDGKGGIPQAIEKVVDGKKLKYPAWVGQTADREGTSTLEAGRTSGHDLVFRVSNVNEVVSDEVFLSNFFDANGKLIRGRKESVAKELAQELGLEYLLDEIQNNPKGQIAQSFETSQEALGVKNFLSDISQVQDLIAAAERGGVKRSVTDAALSEIIAGALLVELNTENRLEDLATYFEQVQIDYKLSAGQIASFKAAYYQANLLTNNRGGFIQPIEEAAATLPDNVRNSVVEWLNMDQEQRTKALGKFTEKLALKLPSEIFTSQGLGDQILGISGTGGRYVEPKTTIGKKIINNKNKKSKVKYTFDQTHVKYMQAGSGFLNQIANQILNKDFKTQEELDAAWNKKQSNGKSLLEMWQEANAANPVALQFILEQAAEVVADNPSLVPGYMSWLQAQTNLGQSLRGLTTLGDVQVYLENQAPFVGKMKADGTRQGYQSLSGRAKELYDQGKIVINRDHPLFEEIYNEIQRPNKKGELKFDPNDETKLNYWFRDKARPKGEHKEIASNKFGEIAIAGLDIISDMMNNNNPKGRGVLKSTYRLVLADQLSEFSQQLVHKVIADVQDLKLGSTTTIDADLRMYSVPTKYMNSLMPAPGNIDAKARAKQALQNLLNDIDINAFTEVMTEQQAINNASKRSYTTDTKGISVYDFDDTLVFSNSKIGVTKNGKKTFITPAQFAVRGEKLTAEGAEFDFSQFNEVVEGRPGPLAPRLKKAIDKFGNKNIFVLTARPQASAKAIFNFLKGIGLEIPLENITGLENGSPAAKAGWMVSKVAEGYNDFYFVDDAIKNVKAVKEVLDVFDVNGKIQQARVKRSQSMSDELNSMINRTTGIKPEATYSKVVARKEGRNKGKFKMFVPYGAEDFRGLTSYVIAGKGKQGEADQEFFEKNLIAPYVRGIGAMEIARQTLKEDYRSLLKLNPEIKKKLNKEIGYKNYTNDQAVRVYLYTQSGYEVPGISKRDQVKLLSLINKDVEMQQFADALQVITKSDVWVKPDEFWDVGSILKDFNTFNENVSRKEFLAEFIENVDIVFSESNLNKLEAVYGTNYRKALEDSIRRMKSGSNRPGQAGRYEQKWLNWVNNSVGTIMFFNRKSALLQMLSFANFTNWSDNNPLQAAAAFANQPLYWKTWVKIFNSPKLKQRRGGLKSDVQEQEIADAARNSDDKFSAVISYLLKIGFTPTQIADNIAIATGGSTFLINRTKTYLKQGMTQAEADKKAFEDFSKISDETQQSGDPMLISSQQASHLGRLILAFQNTPMQYTRLMKKAGQDLINGRGDTKTNISKILYYGFVQNLIFSGLQQALFAMLPGFGYDDDEEYEQVINTKMEKTLNSMVDTILRGSGLTGAVISTLKNTINRYYYEEKKGFTADHAYTLLELANVSPPIGSKLRKVYGAIQTKRFDSDLMNITGMEVTRDGRLNISPSYKIIGNLTTAFFNLPVDRMIIETEAIGEMLDERNSSLQRIALGLGFRTWDVNAKNEEHELLKTIIKEEKKIRGKLKAKETREENKRREAFLKALLTPVQAIEVKAQTKGMSITKRIEFLEKYLNL